MKKWSYEEKIMVIGGIVGLIVSQGMSYVFDRYEKKAITKISEDNVKLRNENVKLFSENVKFLSENVYLKEQIIKMKEKEKKEEQA